MLYEQDMYEQSMEYTYAQPQKIPWVKKKKGQYAHLIIILSSLLLLAVFRVRMVRDLGEPFTLCDFARE